MARKELEKLIFQEIERQSRRKKMKMKNREIRDQNKEKAK